MKISLMATFRKINLSSGCFSLMIFSGLCLMVFGCGSEPPEPVVTASGGLTFFGLGADSVYTKDVRKRLANELGSDAIAARTTIDLAVHRTDLLTRFFPKLHRLNKLLNDDAEARVEHDTVKLMYRYVKRKKRPFKYVELLFSNHTQKPLYFKVTAKKEGSGIIGAFQEKHGTPRKIEWDDGDGTSLYWKEGKNILIASITTDRFGDLEYHIMMYFVENIEALIETDKIEALKYENERKKAGESAFN